MKNFLLSLVLSVLFPWFVSADIIVLKNGKRIEKVRAWEEDGQVKCYRFGSVIGYPKENVERVEEKEVEEKVNEATSRRKEARSDSDEQDYFHEKQAYLRNNSLGQFKVIKVYDGDSFMATGHNIDIKVRLVGIDAPETANKRERKPGQPCSEEAKKYLAKMVLNKTINIRSYGMGSYNRQLAEVFAGNRNVSLELLRSGFAEVYRGKLPKGFDLTPYRKAEMEARESRKGIWALKNKYISPKKWRKMYNK